jgi:hypothetical protein
MKKDLYLTATSLLGKRLSLDSDINPAFGCAAAVSFILNSCGYNVGDFGISGTWELNEWLKKHAIVVTEPKEGDILISVTGTGRLANGHCGFFGIYNKMYDKDYAILSNNSRTGKLDTQWQYSKWVNYYCEFGKLTTIIYRLQ